MPSERCIKKAWKDVDSCLRWNAKERRAGRKGEEGRSFRLEGEALEQTGTGSYARDCSSRTARTLLRRSLVEKGFGITGKPFVAMPLPQARSSS